MRRQNALPELLAPAGSYDALVAAVNAGADAVYFGGSAFNARAFAKNMDTSELERAIGYAHLHGVRAYITLNTLVFDRELDELVRFADAVEKMGIDAAIVADMGAISRLQRDVPSLPLHGSTQLSAHSADGVNELAALGLSRVVTARELSLENIRTAVEKSAAEIEIFVHGALCVSHSGQCLFSSLVGGRSGNRGECAQPCRLPYNGKYPLSLKDLSLADHITEILECGAASLKIEGRMKSPEYVYGVTKIYRRLLDEGRNATRAENARLAEIFSRSGFTDGYFCAKHQKPMTGVRTDGEKRMTSALDSADTEEKRVKITAKARFALKAQSRFTLEYGDLSVTAVGDAPEVAQNAPLTYSGVAERLAKTGNTPFVLDIKDIEIELDDGINLSPAKINALRREATDKLAGLIAHTRIDNLKNGAGTAQPADSGSTEADSTQKTHADSTKSSNAESINFAGFAVTESAKVGDTESVCNEKDAFGAKEPTGQKRVRTALFLDEKVFDGVDISFFDFTFLPLFSLDGAKKQPSGVYIPPIVTDAERTEVLSRLKTARARGIKIALCGNIGHFALAREADMEIFGDFRLNITNEQSARAYREMGVSHLILSPELSIPQIRDIGGAAITYGRIPLMLLERCFMRENGGCDRCGKISFTDRMGVKFPLMREYPHRNLLLNSKITYMGDRGRELAQIKGGEHFIFTVESAKDAEKAIEKYKNREPMDGIRRIK